MAFVCHEKQFPGGVPRAQPKGKQMISALLKALIYVLSF